MNKIEFFEKLNKDLSSKYNLLPIYIETIRSAYLGGKLSRKELAEEMALKLSLRRRDKYCKTPPFRRHSKKHYQDLLNFIASCSEETWNDVTQITEFDKSTPSGTAKP